MGGWWGGSAGGVAVVEGWRRAYLLGSGGAELVSGGEGRPGESGGGRRQRRELFISYSQKDQRWLEDLKTHLKPLEMLCDVRIWDDSRIDPGQEWLKEIEAALARARVALLLVSKNFLASEFIQRKELPSLFAAAESDGLTILWLPLLPCSWKRFRQIEQYQAVIPAKLTLGEMDEVQRDRALVQITDRIHDVFERQKREQGSVRQGEAAGLTAEEARESDIQGPGDVARRSLAQRLAEETLQVERLGGESAARAEAERWRVAAEEWRAEAEQARAELERLKNEQEEGRRPAASTASQHPNQAADPAVLGFPLVSIPVVRGWLEKDGQEWRKREEEITVSGYREELAAGIGMTMVQIPAGEFLMGSPEDESGRSANEGPQHAVKLRSYCLGQTPVTQAQWGVVASWPRIERELKTSPSRFAGPDRPVTGVSWDDAREFCRRLCKHSGRTYALPTEAQWEYACRAGTTTPFSCGETLTVEMANYDGNYTYGSAPRGLYRGQTVEVGSFPANPWGLHDMHGNVWEWCMDPWHESYVGAPRDGNAWTNGGGESKLLRGGSWNYGPRDCRSAIRNHDSPGNVNITFGFRVVCLPQVRST
ncbi:MAG: SUMF1/EgtB/PvdO family nonheme iron enzyme [Cyanobacteriota bacterium]|nr:SUMF1/EgtB/PvdO family nonheme iron enzyme [Cyanobacteriota bacterium]